MTVLLTTVCGHRARAALPLPASSAGSDLVGGDSHRASGARDSAGGVVDIVGVQVRLLGPGYLAELVGAQMADLVRVRGGRSLGDPGSLLDELGGGRGLRDEGERTVLVHRDLDRHDVPALRFGGGVVRLAELHDVDAVLAQRGADRRGGRGGASLNLELDVTCDLLLGRHVGSFSS